MSAPFGNIHCIVILEENMFWCSLSQCPTEKNYQVHRSGENKACIYFSHIFLEKLSIWHCLLIMY